MSGASDMSGLRVVCPVFEPGDHMLPEVRMARVLDAIGSHRAGRLSCVEAGELLGFSERHFRGDGERQAVPSLLQLREERAATAGIDDQGAPSRGPSPQARAATAAGHDVVPRRLEACLAGPGFGSRPDCDDGRRDQAKRRARPRAFAGYRRGPGAPD